MKVCIFGLGEAGSLFADDLIAAGAEVTAYDPADVPTPYGVERRSHPSLSVRRADVVLSVTAQADARLAFLQALDAVDRSALYADLSTSAPQVKAELSDLAARRSLDFADVALMAMVPGNGIAVPSMVCGTGAERYQRILGSFGAEVEPISGPAGTASAKKLARSVMMKGVAAVIVEAVEAGAAADDLEWLWSNLTGELRSADDDWARRMVVGSKQHARRRMHEMESASEMLRRLGTPTTMTEATVASLRRLIDTELPELPPATAEHAGAAEAKPKPKPKHRRTTSDVPKPERPVGRKQKRRSGAASHSKPKPAAPADRSPIVTGTGSPSRSDAPIDPGVPTGAIDDELEDELLLAGPLVAGDLDNPPSDEAVDAAIHRIKAILDEEEALDPDDEFGDHFEGHGSDDASDHAESERGASEGGASEGGASEGGASEGGASEGGASDGDRAAVEASDGAPSSGADETVDPDADIDQDADSAATGSKPAPSAGRNAGGPKVNAKKARAAAGRASARKRAAGRQRDGDGVDAEGAVVINFRPRNAAAVEQDDDTNGEIGSDPADGSAPTDTADSDVGSDVGSDVDSDAGGEIERDGSERDELEDR